MIDKITAINKLALRRKENNNDEMLDAYYHSALKPDIVIEMANNARRYLILKEQFAPFSMDIDGKHSWCWRGSPSRMKGNTLDNAIDGLLDSK
jgi:hypothetical protein